MDCYIKFCMLCTVYGCTMYMAHRQKSIWIVLFWLYLLMFLDFHVGSVHIAGIIWKESYLKPFFSAIDKMNFYFVIVENNSKELATTKLNLLFRNINFSLFTLKSRDCYQSHDLFPILLIVMIMSRVKMASKYGWLSTVLINMILFKWSV